MVTVKLIEISTTDKTLHKRQTIKLSTIPKIKDKIVINIDSTQMIFIVVEVFQFDNELVSILTTRLSSFDEYLNQLYPKYFKDNLNN